MRTIIVTLSVFLFITGITADCPVTTAIDIYPPDSDTSTCKLDVQTITNGSSVTTSCGVVCGCGKNGLQCCKEHKCTMVDGDCEIIELNLDGSPGCALA